MFDAVIAVKALSNLNVLRKGFAYVKKKQYVRPGMTPTDLTLVGSDTMSERWSAGSSIRVD